MSYFKKTIITDGYGWSVEATPMDELRVANAVRLVGSTFSGSTIDPTFWSIVSASATATQTGGEIVLASTTSGSGSVVMQSVRSGRYVGGNSNRYRAQIQLSDTGKANNTKKWGMFDGSNGCYFKLSGSSMSVCTMKAGSETPVASASWNGSTTLPTLTNCTAYEIYITNSKVYFVIAGTLVHTTSAPTTTWTETTTLPIRVENINSGNTVDTTINIRVNTIYRLGQLQTLPTYRHISTGSATICKYGAGNLHRIVVNDPSNTSVTVYDSVSGSGNVIGIIDPGNGTLPFTLEYHVPFSVGLTVVPVGSIDLTVVFE